MQVTIFRNIHEIHTPFYRDVSFVIDRIRDGHHKDRIKEIRREKDKSNRNELKKSLPAVCFSGVFKKRSDNAIVEHSGLICLDFDGYKTKKLMQSEKESLMSDPYIMSVFVSPSGNGLKALVKVPAEAENHKRYFDALGEYFDSEYFDISTKNVSRVCYESYDPDIYVNMDSDLWDKYEEEYKAVDKYKDQVTIPITDDNKVIEILVKWWTKKYPMVEGQRNNNAYILAAALNEYGINKTLAEFVLGRYSTKGFSAREIKTTVDSAYKNTMAHGTKYYEDNAAVSKIRVRVNNGESAESIKESTSNVDEDVLNEVVKNLEKDSSVKKFWVKSEKGNITLVHYLYKEFLQYNGFYKFAPHGSMNYEFVRVTNNLINNSSVEEIKDFVLNYLEGFDDLSVYNFFAERTKYFAPNFLSLIDTVEVHFVSDTKEYSHIYFKNCTLKVTKDDVEAIDYVDLDGYVWQDRVIDRNFDFCNDTDCDFSRFVANVCGNDQSRVLSLRSAIGYLMSGYKDPMFCPAVIFNDEVISDNPQGGTGKGLVVQGIGKMKKVSIIDGKSFSFDQNFKYQTIDTDSQVICFDDVRKTFNFERLFSVITEGLTIERKNMPAINIPFRHSPKVSMTTNYTIRGRGNSFERRKFEVELRQYYTKKFTPVDDFGRRLFDEWDDDEWCSFDNYMIGCLQWYLKMGLIEHVSKNTSIKKLAADTCHEFIEWAGLIEDNEGSDILRDDRKIFKDELYNDFVNDNPDFAPRAKRSISRTAFYRWLIYYGDFRRDVEVIDGRSKQGRWIIFKTEAYEEKESSQQEIEGLEF